MTKNLVWLDQTPLLQQAIRELESWHERIETLEIEIQRFQDHDLKLFTDWERLIIQKHQSEIDELRQQYEKLTRFHNWVVFTAEDQNISLPHAYFLMMQEEELHQTGTQKQREKIEATRKARQTEIDEQINGYADDEDEDDDVDDDNDLDNDLDEEPPENDGRSREEKINQARQRHEDRILFFERLSDKKIKAIMKDFEEGIFLLVECVGVCLEAYRFDLIIKIWNRTPARTKKSFNEGFKNEFGVTLDTFLQRATETARDQAGVDEDEEFDFSAHFENPFASSEKQKKIDPETAELAKIFYRRLMMKVHPDKLPPGFVSSKKAWLDRLWKKIQNAYDAANASALEKLHLQVLITLKKYDEVSLTELKQGSGLLQHEFNRIHDSQRQTRQHPAWGFSELGSYKKLEKEVVKPYKGHKKNLKKDLDRLHELHASLRDHAQRAARGGGFPQKGQRRRRKKSARL